MNKIGSSAQGMFEGLKNKLGFSHTNERDTHSYRDSDYDEYDDFDEYDERHHEESEYNSGHNEPSHTTGFKPVSVSSSYKSSSPDLVGFNDVKSYSRDHDLDRRQTDNDRFSYSTRRSTNRNLVHGSQPAISSPAHQAQSKRNSIPNERSEGFNSLFMSTTSPSNERMPESRSQGARSASYSDHVSNTFRQNSYSSFYSKREVSIVSPRSYEDVSNVAQLVALGNLVVVSFNQLNDTTKMRILDFCFGVASALHAQVESPSSSLYVIAKGEGMSEEERATLIERGLLPRI